MTRTAKNSRKTSSAQAGKKGESRRPGKRPTLSQLNAWITAHHDELLDKARKNCIRLTGSPTFGGTTRRKSA